MPAKKRNARSSAKSGAQAISLTDTQRIIRLMAMLAIKGESHPEKIKILLGSGFANTEIAEILGMKANAVNQAIHRIKSKS